MENSQLTLWDDSEDKTIKADSIKSLKVKLKKSKKVTEESKNAEIDQIMQNVEAEVNRILGTYKNATICLRTKEALHDYITAAINNKIIAIDTETNNSLDVFGDDFKLMGACIYTPGQKNAYVPINHINRFTNERLQDQLTEADLMIEFQRLLDNKVFEVYHNAIFDIETIQNTCGIKLKASWDTMVAAHILNENELKGLKVQYKLHINSIQEKYDIEHLFSGLPYAIFDPNLFALYAATDSYMTYKLYLWQLEQYNKEENKKLLDVLYNIEFPILDVVVDMETRGVDVDLPYAAKLKEIYKEKVDRLNCELNEELLKLKPKIDKWRLSKDANIAQINEKTGKAGKSKNEQLADPIKLTSSTQMAILLYDILKAPVVDTDSPRGTGTAILEELAYTIPFCAKLNEVRGYEKLLSSFIEAIPTFVKSDGKVHARFNPIGTVTGRFASEKPSLQQIPSHETSIRQLFRGGKGRVIVGGDFSGQEPHCTAVYSNDTEMIKSYNEGKDLYATVGSMAFNVKYEECLEFNPTTGELQVDGKARRKKAKTIFLAITYGMSAKTLAGRINVTVEEAKKFIDNFYKGFSGVKEATDRLQADVKKYGYVETLYGTRRHLPDAQLPEYSVTRINPIDTFNPLLGTKEHADSTLANATTTYISKLKAATSKTERDKIVADAKKAGYIIRNNGGFISRAARQTFNSVIQGSAAEMTKVAMIILNNDQRLKDLGFELLTTIHDEVFGSAPVENAEKVAELVKEDMITAAKEKCGNVKWKVDPYTEMDGWYESESCAAIKNYYDKILTKYNNSDDIFKDVYKNFPMYNKDSIRLVCTDKYKFYTDSLKYGPNYFGTK